MPLIRWGALLIVVALASSAAPALAAPFVPSWLLT